MGRAGEVAESASVTQSGGLVVFTFLPEEEGRETKERGQGSRMFWEDCSREWYPSQLGVAVANIQKTCNL
jgi:hypothetical protein